MKDYYAILQVDLHADRREIQAAYRRLAKQYHPDVNKSPNAHAVFCEITEAYDFLMNHPVSPAGKADVEGYQRTEEYERFRKEARERAQKQAKMRYEKFRKQHEAFQKSGINDLAILLNIAGRTCGLVLFVFLLFLPFVVAIFNGWGMLVLVFFTWPFAAAIGWFIYDHRKNYFMPGKIYYTPDRIRHLFTDTHPSDLECYYCPGRKANSIPYRIELYKLKDLKISTGGFRQHQVQYSNTNTTIQIPRSQKALLVHTFCTALKGLTLLAAMIFFPVTSFVWRFIAGMVTGSILCIMILAVLKTRSNVSYLFSKGMILRICLWFVFILLASKITLRPFNMRTSDSIQFVITAIIVFDCFLMQLFDMILGKRAAEPVVRQFGMISARLGEGYRVYNDIPVLSVIYPFLKWFFG